MYHLYQFSEVRNRVLIATYTCHIEYAVVVREDTSPRNIISVEWCYNLERANNERERLNRLGIFAAIYAVDLQPTDTSIFYIDRGNGWDPQAACKAYLRDLPKGIEATEGSMPGGLDVPMQGFTASL